MLTEKDYCDYDTCVALKELRFNTLVDWYFNEDKIIVSSLARYRSTSIPRISLYEAQKWLREEKGMLLQPTYLELSDEWICVIRDKNKRHGYSAQKQKHYEESLSEGIKKAVKLLINNKNE
jgi:hypothetical protein